LGTTTSATFTYNIMGKIIMLGEPLLFTPITVTMYHECFPYSITASTSPIIIDYTDGTTGTPVSISSAFSITPSSPAVPSNCFPISLSLTHPSITPTPITTNTLINLASTTATSIDVPKKTLTMTAAMITEHGSLTATGILAGSIPAVVTVTLNYYHSCYKATIT
jgi:hypothetical protein